jgi:hypothetical protein
MNLTIYLDPDYHHLIENLPENMEIKNIEEYFETT